MLAETRTALGYPRRVDQRTLQHAGGARDLPDVGSKLVYRLTGRPVLLGVHWLSAVMMDASP